MLSQLLQVAVPSDSVEQSAPANPAKITGEVVVVLLKTDTPVTVDMVIVAQTGIEKKETKNKIIQFFGTFISTYDTIWLSISQNTFHKRNLKRKK